MTLKENLFSEIVKAAWARDESTLKLLLLQWKGQTNDG